MNTLLSTHAARPPRSRAVHARHVLLPAARAPRNTAREHAFSPPQKAALAREQPLAWRLTTNALSAFCLHTHTSQSTHNPTSRGAPHAHEGSHNAYHRLHPWTRAHCTVQRRRLATNALSSILQHICTNPAHLSAHDHTRRARPEDRRAAHTLARVRSHSRATGTPSSLSLACTCSTLALRLLQLPALTRPNSHDAEKRPLGYGLG